MNYGQLIREAWAITWRARFLWVLGLLAGAAVGMPSLQGSSPNLGPGWGELDNLSSELGRLAGEVGAWALANLGLVIGIAVVVVLLGLAVLTLSSVAESGRARATVDLAEGRPTSLGHAWSAGRRLFWRYVGLAALIGAVVVLPFGVGQAFGSRPITLVTTQVILNLVFLARRHRRRQAEHARVLRRLHFYCQLLTACSCSRMRTAA